MYLLGANLQKYNSMKHRQSQTGCIPLIMLLLIKNSTYGHNGQLSRTHANVHLWRKHPKQLFLVIICNSGV